MLSLPILRDDTHDYLTKLRQHLGTRRYLAVHSAAAILGAAAIQL
jgi:hypothetical protein